MDDCYFILGSYIAGDGFQYIEICQIFLIGTEKLGWTLTHQS